MKHIVVFFSFLFFAVSAQSETNIEGIKIGDSASSLEKLTLTLTNHEKYKDIEAKKYKAKDGNELSITVQKGKVVYIEYDWSQEEKSTQTPFNDFIFGKTTVNEVRSRFGNNGFVYKNNATVEISNGLATFNCYELIYPKSNIFVVVTKVVLKPGINASNLADHLKLDALILADSTFLDEIWGKEKIYDPAYKKISF